MSDIKEKVEMELKPLEKICDEVQDKLEEMIKSSQEVAPETVLAVAKTFGEIVDAKKDIVEMCYKKQIMEAMEENADEYGETWDEDGVIRKGYKGQPRDSKGRYTSRRNYEMTPEMYNKYPAEYYRDLDRNKGMMYYTPNSNMGGNSSDGGSYQRGYENGMRDGRNQNMSRSAMQRKNYQDSKMIHKDNSNESKAMNANELKKWLDTIYDELKETLMMDGNVSNEEKTVLNSFIPKMQTLMK